MTEPRSSHALGLSLTRRRFLEMLAVAGGAAVVGCAPPAPQSLTKVPVGIVSLHAGYWPFYVSKRKGMWQENGLEVETTVTQTVVTAVQSAAAGNTVLTFVTADNVIAAIEKGADLVAIFGGENSNAYSLIVQPSITSYEQLRGKSIGVSALNSGDAFFVQQMAEKAGLKAGKDFDMVQAGGTPERYAALKSNAIAGALLTQPFDFKILKEGFKRLGVSNEARKYYAWSPVWVRKSWAQSNEDTIVRSLKAMRKAHIWLYDPKNKNEAIQILVDEVKADPEEAALSYELLVEKVKTYSQQGELPEEAMQSPIDFLALRGDLKPPLPPPSKYIDMSYFKKAGGEVR